MGFWLLAAVAVTTFVWVAVLTDWVRGEFATLKAQIKALRNAVDVGHASIKADSDKEHDKHFAEECRGLMDSCLAAGSNRPPANA